MAKMKKKHIVITTIVASAVLVVGFYGFIAIDTILNLPFNRIYSDMSIVNYIIREELQRHYDQEGCYPNSLDMIKETIITNLYIAEVPDNPKELKLFPRFEYSTDGENYSITWSIRNRGTVHTRKEFGRSGGLVKVEHYIDGDLFKFTNGEKTRDQTL